MVGVSSKKKLDAKVGCLNVIMLLMKNLESSANGAGNEGIALQWRVERLNQAAGCGHVCASNGGWPPFVSKTYRKAGVEHT